MKINATVQKLIAELLGTTLIAISFTAAVASTKAVPQFAIGITVALAILVTVNISGAHLNPLISLYFFSKKSLTGALLAGFIGVQVIGAVCGAVIGRAMWGATLLLPEVGTVPEFPLLISEWVFTGGLIFLVGYLIFQKRAQLLGIVIPVWVIAGIGFTPTGAQGNPAVSIALMFAGEQDLQTVAWFVVAQAAGMLTGLIGLAVFTAKPSKPAKKVAAAKASNRTKKA